MSLPGVRPRQYPLWVLIFFLAALLWFAPLFWRQVETTYEKAGHDYHNSDLYQFIYPAYNYIYSRISDGALPLWNPHQLCGTPLTGHPQAAIFQPLHVLFFFVPVAEGLALHAFVCLVLLGAAMLLLGRSLRLSAAAALVGAAAFTFSGATAAAMSRPSLAGGLAWGAAMVWALAAWRERGGRRYSLAAGIFLGFALLSGAYALTLVWFTLAAVVYGSIRAAPPAAADLPRPGASRLLLALCLGAALGLPQWGPSLLQAPGLASPWAALLRHPAAGDCPSHAGLWLVQALACRPGFLPRMPYWGIATLVLIPAAWLHPRLGRLAWSLTGLGAASVAVLVLGAARWPGGPALAHGAAFCAAVLAALGADMLCSRPYVRPLARWGGGLLCLGVAAGLFVVGGSLLRGYAAVLAILLLVMLALPFRYMATSAVLACALLLYADLSIASVNGFRHPLRDSPRWHEAQRPAFEEAQSQAAKARIALAAAQNDFMFPANGGMLYGLYMAGGAHWLLTREQTRWWQALGVETGLPAWAVLRNPPAQRNLIDFMAVRLAAAAPEFVPSWSAGGADSGFHGGIQKTGSLSLWTNAGALPRAYWTPEAVRASAAQAQAALADNDFPRDRQCIISGNPYLSDLQTESALSRLDAACTLEDVSPERVEVHVEAPVSGWLVLLDSYDPGWTAAVNGEWASVHRANGLFRAVRVPAGRSRVVFRYRPVGVYLCLAGGAAAGAALLGMLLGPPAWTWQRKRRGKGGTYGQG